MKYRIFLKKYGPKNQNKEEENNFLFEGIFFPGVKLIMGTIRYRSFQNVAIKKKNKKKTGNRIQNRKAQKSNNFHYI